MKFMSAILCLVSFFLPVQSARAQLTGTLDFELAAGSHYEDFCDVGTACLVVWCGEFDQGGTLTMEYTGFDGTYDQYDVIAIDWDFHRGFCPGNLNNPVEQVTGIGSFQISRDPMPVMQMALDLAYSSNNFISNLDSGFVTSTTAFPSFQNFVLRNIQTAETLTLNMDLVNITTPADFLRGDPNSDMAINLADVIVGLNFLFDPNSPSLACEDTIDANDDGTLNISDIIFLLGAVFGGSNQLPEPTSCGADPTMDSLDCAASVCP